MIRRLAAVAVAALIWGCEDNKQEPKASTGTGATSGAMPTAPKPAAAPATQDAGAAMMAATDAGAATATATAGAASSGPVTAADKKAADEIFATRCSTCHGTAGKGDGPASAALNPKPRAFSDAEWQKSVTDEHIEKIIAFGGTAVGKSPLMPPNPDLAGKPVVQALREKVRAYGTK